VITTIGLSEKSAIDTKTFDTTELVEWVSTRRIPAGCNLKTYTTTPSS